MLSNRWYISPTSWEASIQSETAYNWETEQWALSQGNGRSEIKILLKGYAMQSSHYRVVVSVLCSLLFLLTLLPSVVFAADGEDSWEFHIAPYAWLAGLNGTVATLPGLPPADIEMDFQDDIIDNVQGALMLVGEARKDRFGIAIDVAYTDIESDSAIPGQNFTTLSSKTKNWLVTAAGFYRLMDTGKASVDALAGIRYWSVDSELALSGGPLGSYSVDNKEQWIDPLVGLKGLTMLGGSKFFMSGFLMIGGFGAGSDFMWDLNANLGYRWGEMFSTTIGYRYLDVDYENDGFLYDVAQHGPTLGLSWRF